MGTLKNTGAGLGFVILVALAPAARAFQVPIDTWDSQAPEIGFGMVLAAAGDVNGDGVPDAITGSPNSQGYRGAARVISGADGSTLFAYTNPKPTGKPLDYLGFAVAGCGDLDGDGLCEFVVGQPFVSAVELGGRARVYRGSDGSVLYELAATTFNQQIGTGVADVGDVDDDGIDDVAIGDAVITVGPLHGAVTILSGADGHVVKTLLGPPGSIEPRFGAAVAGAGDVNLDGVPDVIVGAPNASYSGIDNHYGAFFVHSGATGNVIFGMDGTYQSAMGSAVAGGVDVDGSGSPDVLVGSPGFQSIGFTGTAGEATLFQGLTHYILGTFPGVSVGDAAGWSVALGDVDLDGRGDVLVGEPMYETAGHFQQGRVRVYSGLGFGVIAEAVGAESADMLGYSVAVLGDLDHDFAPEWGAGVPAGGAAGQVQLFASTSAWHDVGSALAGTGGAPHVTPVGSLQPSSAATLKLAGGPPFAAATLIAGVSALEAPFKGGVLVPTPDVLLPGLPLDASGALTLPSTWPASAPSGFSFWLQFWMPDAGAPKGWSASNGVMGTAP